MKRVLRDLNVLLRIYRKTGDDPVLKLTFKQISDKGQRVTIYKQLLDKNSTNLLR